MLLLGSFAATSAAVAGPTFLPLRLEAGTCSYNGSTTQTIEYNQYGASLATLPFTGTTNYDFYSPPLTNAQALTTANKGGGTLWGTNGGATDFTVTARLKFYDYDPGTGNETLIVDTGSTGDLPVPARSNGPADVPTTSLSASHTVPIGHLLHIRVGITLVSGSPGPNSSFLFNAPSSQAGASVALLPQESARAWGFGVLAASPSASIVAPSSVCASSAGNTASVPNTTGATYAWTIVGGTITAGSTTNQVSFTSGASGSVTLGVTVTRGCSSTSSALVAITGNTSTALSSSANPSVTGQSVVFTATVTAVSPAIGTPAGTVRFKTNGVNFGSAVTLSGGSASSLAVASLAVGNYTVTADYSGSGTFCASSGALSGGQTVNKAGSSTVLTSSQNPSIYGQSVTFTATVAAVSPGLGTPSGTIAFKDGSTTLGTRTLNGSGVATLATNKLSVSGSPHSVTAVYAGDNNFSGSASSAVSQIINKAALTVSGVTANNKIFDGTTAATLNTGSAALVGMISGDTVALNSASAAGAFADNTVGDGKTVTVSGLTISGAGSGNYALAQPTAAANIMAPDPVPRLMAAVSTNLGRNLTAFGKLGVTYQLQYSTNLAQPLAWYPLLNYVQTNGVMTINVDSAAPIIFYRLFQP